MSSNALRHMSGQVSCHASVQVICRLLGGSGRPSLVAVPTRKLPALFAPMCRIPAGALVQSCPLPLPLAA
jgi:hypothetical protein